MNTIPRQEVVEALRSVPTGWRWVRLGDHVTKIGSGITPFGGQTTYKPSGIALIRSQNVHLNRFVSDGLVYISPEQDEEMISSRVVAGDVLLNITGASIGRVCVVPNDICPANVNQHVSIIRVQETVDPHFLSYYISTPAFQKFIMSTQAGATRQALTKALIERFEIPLPTVAEQRRIVAILNEQMEVVETARVATEAQLEATITLGRAYLRAVFTSPKAQHWPKRRLGDEAKLLSSKSIATDGDTVVQAITTACLDESGFQPSGVKLARMWASDATECIVSPGEILIARSNTPELVGRVAMFAGNPKGAVASDLTIRLWAIGNIAPSFLTAYLSFLYMSGYWKDRAGGASGSMKKITRTQILDERVPVPPLPQQLRIAAILDEQMAMVKRIGQALEERFTAIQKLPAALRRVAFGRGH